MELNHLDPGKIDTGRRTPEQAARLKRIIALRQAGLTWAEIGRNMGITRQAASQAVKKFEQRSKA